MAQKPEFRFQILRSAQVEGQRINIWRPAPFPEIIPLILLNTDQAIFVPDFDADEFVLPDPNLFRTTDAYSNGELRGFTLRNGKNIARISEDAEYLMSTGRVLRDTVMQGTALPRDSRFMLLQTFFKESEYDLERKKYTRAKEEAAKEARKALTKKDLGSHKGRTRFS